MGWFKDMVKSWLEIIPADDRRVVINEPMSFSEEAIRGKVWYRGNADELEQMAKQTAAGSTSASSFWAAVPETEQLRKIHSGVPALIVDTLTYVVKSDLGDVTFRSDEGRTEWEEIAKEIDFHALIGKALSATLAVGDGAFKISVDTDISDYPLVEFYPSDKVDFLQAYGKVYGVDFWSDRHVGKKTYRLRERYTREQVDGSFFARVDYTLFDGDKEVPLDRVPELAALKPAHSPGDYLMAVPLKIYDSPRFPGRGKAVYDGKYDVFDAHDEVISQWIDALRAGRVQKYIPDDLLPRDPSDGSIAAVNAFGNNMIALNGSAGIGDDSKIQVVQPDIRYDAFLSTYSATLDMCLQGIISPATLGINVGKMSSDEAQREKKDVTGNTRNTITAVLEKVLPKLVRAILLTYDGMRDKPPGNYEPEISFGEYGSPDFGSRIGTIGEAAASNIMSVESQVEELWGDSKDEKWKEKEVQRIKQMRGIEVSVEPSVSDELTDAPEEVPRDDMARDSEVI